MEGEVLLEQEKTKESNYLKIYTLGDFRVEYQGNCLANVRKNSNKLWELFKYLLTNRNKRLPPEKIVDTLWPEQDYADPKTAVHSLVYRLRKLLDINGSINGKNDNNAVNNSHINLDYSQEGYLFRLNQHSWLDVDEFITLSIKATKLCYSNPETAKQLYREALSLYKGAYLPEYYHKYWPMPARYYYRRIYMKTLTEYLAMLRDESNFSEVSKVCEQALLIEPFLEEEQLHLYFMESLVQEGKLGEALSYYEYINTMYKQEFESSLPTKLQNFYKEIKNGNGSEYIKGEAQNNYFDLKGLKVKKGVQIKNTNESQGGFYCNKDFFIKLYKLEKLRSERTEKPPVLVDLTVVEIENDNDLSSIEKYSAKIEEVLVTNLRKGDAICRWSDKRFLVLLSNTKAENAYNFIKRIQTEFNCECYEYNVSLVGIPLTKLPE
ncbi:BTAD domain-containing putative transcriptional regulator [Natranaerobius thermophilus]|uniref:Response regulator receiver and SARP domain protein n=1 Tax=Natranaerobius thermophilus (strain ATCC BAA-1301 / DSM 18059 / JW/NM-WN-LF) TaxID=457570 RepID=B2A2E2_NATTJ|nr:BTAD domain-containing putative transcriptional regulator [Natranaerobius thermophilus]ACB86248.1 response regulator receiver and SARP domain protein [Natranaerobius thermophilus JW/NM-WN-LF]